jgi:hypothetical protein
VIHPHLLGDEGRNEQVLSTALVLFVVPQLLFWYIKSNQVKSIETLKSDGQERKAYQILMKLGRLFVPSRFEKIKLNKAGGVGVISVWFLKKNKKWKIQMK